jgi:hypothetical protein
MNHSAHHATHHDPHRHDRERPADESHAKPSLNHLAFLATLHCLSGCAIGEVLGMFIGTALGLSNPATIGMAVLLAFAFGYAFTIVPLLRAGMMPGRAARLALLADTASISVMEAVDNAVMVAVPGAMDAPVSSPLFWAALAFSLIVAAVAAFPVNRWLITRGKGHAAVHVYHSGT